MKIRRLKALVKTAIKVEAKAKIQAFDNCNTNKHYYQSNELMYTIAAKIQIQATKDVQTKNLRFKV